MQIRIACIALTMLFMGACRQSRIHEKDEWAQYFTAHGIQNGCFMLRDNNHEAIYYYNKDRCLVQYTPASTFKVFNALVALETVKAPDDQFVIPWDSVVRPMEEWNRDLSLREAFRVSAVPYFQEMARRIGPDNMQHYLDTASYGNRRMGGKIDEFWLNDTLKISADEQVGLMKRLYFGELPFSDRSQRIVKSMMLQEETPDYNLYYKTGWAQLPGKQVLWVVGFIEKIKHVKEHEESMNKSDYRLYPYFFAQNFEVPAGDNSKDWGKIRIEILKDILEDFGALPEKKMNTGT